MTLLLTIQTLASSESGQSVPASSTFDHFPVVIGRSPSCDLTLPDPEKFVSSKHAVINCSNNIVSITDTSSNGVFVNGSAIPLGRGNTVALNSADSVTMGEFALSITIGNGSNAPHSSSPGVDALFPDDSASSAHSGRNDDPFAELDDLRPSPAFENAPSVDRLDADISIGPDAWETNDSPMDPGSPDPFADLDSPSASPAPSSQNASSASDDDDWAGWLGEVATGAESQPVAKESPPATPPASKPAVNPGAVTEVSSPQQAARPVPPQANSGDSLDALLSSAGLDPQKFATVNKHELAQHIGRILNRSTQSMMLLLRSRDEIKNAMRTEVTLLAPKGNNPLKFSISVEQALETLLTPSPNNGFTDGEKAIDKGLEDIKIHQLAMLEAMRSALQIALSHFDPAVIEQHSKENNPLVSNLPLAKEAKLWEHFNDRFNAIKRETVDDFSDLFGRELRKAYEKTVEDLKHPMG